VIRELIKIANELDRRLLIIEANRLDELIKQSASGKRNIINLGYPEILTQILQEKFGKNSFLISKWLKEDRYYGWGKEETYQDILEGSSHSWLASLGNSSREDMAELLRLDNAASMGPDVYEDYLKKKKDYYDPDPLEIEFLEEQREALKAAIKEALFKDTFFSKTLISDFMEGKITDLHPYKKMNLQEALEKYNQKVVFEETEPLKVYDDGYKWIDVRNRCELVGKLMRNCGSAGVMGLDPDRTILALFDANNKPHIVTTYHPGEERISAVEGIYHSGAKEEYHKYVLDLIDFLGVKYSDKDTPKSALLKLKYKLKDISKSLDLLAKTSFDEYFVFIDNDGNTFYTDTNRVISKKDLEKIIEYINDNEEYLSEITTFTPKEDLSLEEYVSYAFNYRHRDTLERAVDVVIPRIFNFIRRYKPDWLDY